MSEAGINKTAQIYNSGNLFLIESRRDEWLVCSAAAHRQYSKPDMKPQHDTNTD